MAKPPAIEDKKKTHHRVAVGGGLKTRLWKSLRLKKKKLPKGIQRHVNGKLIKRLYVARSRKEQEDFQPGFKTKGYSRGIITPKEKFPRR